MDREIELVKKEYEEKIKKRKTTQDEKNKSEKGKGSDKAEAEDKKSEDEAAKAEREQDEKVFATYGIRRPCVVDHPTDQSDYQEPKSITCD